MSCLENRQNPLLQHYPIEEIEEAFAKITHYFDNNWLNNEQGSHVLQQLWSRRDALATNELFTFGKSLLAAETVSSKWLKDQIRLVRGVDENNQRGALFEILVVGYTASKQKVTPAPANQPGYDIDIETKKGTLYRSSLKCYSQSSHEKVFQKKSMQAETKFLDGIRKANRNASLYIEAKKYPNESDWQKLYSELHKQASNFDGLRKIFEIDGKWLVGLLPLIPEGNEKFSAGHISHSFVCTSPYHNNEQNNFLSKLESAVSNLERHVKIRSGGLPIIIMRLPVTASASILNLWVKKYFDLHKSSILKSVFFIQPYSASKEDMSSSHIAYFVSSVVADSFLTTSVERLEFEAPVGIVVQQPPKWRLRSDIGEQQLSEQYVYQKGRHYISASKDSQGTLSARISRKAPGIESIAVLNFNGQYLELKGRWGEDLCLISS